MAAACSWRTSMPRMPDSMMAPSAPVIGPPMRKKNVSTPWRLRLRARISLPLLFMLTAFLIGTRVASRIVCCHGSVAFADATSPNGVANIRIDGSAGLISSLPGAARAEDEWGRVMEGERGGRALSGVRVLDLTQHESGSTCTQLLGWMGADVIKVEPPKVGDPGRRIGSPLQTAEPDPSGADAWYFLMHNSNKRSLTLNLKDARGYETFLALVKHADVLVENMGPGTLERMKLGSEVLLKVNPRLIVGRIKGYGLTGPYSTFKSFDTIGQATGGMFGLTGPKGGTPLRAGPSIADSTSGIMCPFGI